MKLDQNHEQELRSVLLNIASTTDLELIASKLNMDKNFGPVQEIAGKSQKAISQFLLSFPKIKETRTRIKTLDSTLFKMMYCRKSDLNKINDIVGFIAVVDDLGACYQLLSELIEGGLKPSFRIYDSLDGTNLDYRSLDANFTLGDHYFQIQIRTLDLQRIYNQGPLTAEAYKERHFKKLHIYLSDQEFGIDYRVALFENIVENFKIGHHRVTSGGIEGFTKILDAYSSSAMNFDQLCETKLTAETRRVLKRK